MGRLPRTWGWGVRPVRGLCQVVYGIFSTLIANTDLKLLVPPKFVCNVSEGPGVSVGLLVRFCRMIHEYFLTWDTMIPGTGLLTHVTK